MTRVWIGFAAVGILFCACSGSSVAQDRATYFLAQRAVTQDQQMVFGMDTAGSSAISCFSAKGASTSTISSQCSFTALKAQALARLNADEAKLSAAAHQLASDNQAP